MTQLTLTLVLCVMHCLGEILGEGEEEFHYALRSLTRMPCRSDGLKQVTNM